MRVLILGGTSEARALASELVERDVAVTTSLAGVTASSGSLRGEVRVGGFGGVAGLTSYLVECGFDVVVDATHPFAATMSEHAALACSQVGVRLIRLQRPSWSERPEASGWTWVPSLTDAAAMLGADDRPFLAVGRGSLAPFAEHHGYALVRVIEPPNDVPSAWEIVRARGPFDPDGEIALMSSRRITHLVSKDAGGATDAKLDAAATLGISVIMVARPDPVRPAIERAESVPGVLAMLQHA